MLNFGRFVGAFLLAMCVFEAYVRMSGIGHVSNLELTPAGIWHRRTENVVSFTEGFSIRSFNQLGCASPDGRFDDDVFRIALIGDSFVLGEQVFERDHFQTVLANGLERRTGRRVHVMNFGYVGSELSDMYARQILRVDRASPNLILYFLDNEDLIPNRGDPLMPEVEVGDGSISVRADFSEQITRRFQPRSRVKQNLAIANMLSQALHRGGQVGYESVLLGLPPRRHANKVILPGTLHPTTKRILMELDATRTVLVDRHHDGKPLADDIYRIARNRGVRIISLRTVLEEMQEQGESPNLWLNDVPGHWNHVGHERIGKFLTNELLEYVSEGTE